MKSVLHIRLDAANIYSSDGIKKAFIAAGYRYYSIDWQLVRFSYGIEHLRMAMIDNAIFISDDEELTIFLHIQNSDILDVATVQKLSKYGFVINYTFDVRDKEGTEWMYQLAPYCGYTFFACWEDVAECASRGIENTGYVHSSCDMDLYKPIPSFCSGGWFDAPEFTYPKTRDIVFIGNRTDITNLKFENAKERAEMIRALQVEFGDKFEVFGLGWDHSRIVSPAEEISIYNSAKIVVTQNQFKRVGYCSDRQWRAMACGTLTICQEYIGIENDLPDYPAVWNTLGRLISLCSRFLFNPISRETNAEISVILVREKHSWLSRINKMESIIEAHKLKNAKTSL